MSTLALNPVIEVRTEEQKLQAIYEKIEIPPIRPIVSRIERYGGHCRCCQKDYVAPVPVGMEVGSPFGNSKLGNISTLHPCD